MTRVIVVVREIGDSSPTIIWNLICPRSRSPGRISRFTAACGQKNQIGAPTMASPATCEFHSQQQQTAQQ
jgi:hypothetical protein